MYVHWPIKDGPVPDVVALEGLIALLVGWVSTGVGVFVHCDAGMNRSALVTACVLVRQGMEPEEAIELVRASRPGALSDEYAEYLRS